MARCQICPWCLKNFAPHPRLGARQKCCGWVDCRKKQKNLSHKQWKFHNIEIYRANQRDWHEAHPDYWRSYRLAHPEYVERNRRQTKARKHLPLTDKSLQKRIDILQLTEINAVSWSIPRFAKSPRSLTLPLSAYVFRHESIACSAQSAPP